MTDLLLVSLGTTRGWRVSDSILVDLLRSAGASVAPVSVHRGLADRLRKGYPVNDFVESYASRRALLAGVAAHRPRAVIMCSTTSALMVPRLDVPYAVRLDTPARLIRPGARNAAVRALERRSLAGARLTIPFSAAAIPELPPGSAPPVVLPSTLGASGPREAGGERLAVAYVPDPETKGLDIVIGAWTQAGVNAELEVFGVEPGAARDYLRRTGLTEPPGITWRGLTRPADFRASLRRARVMVAGARWEDFGQAPLEALADGALLATVPSGGPFEALSLARELDPALVAASIGPEGLAPAIRAAFAMDDSAAQAYRDRAARLLERYRPEALEQTVERELLPALLG